MHAAGLVGMRFNTIGVCDGISMGTDGMSYSLQSRDLIADSIETVMGAPVVRRHHRHPRLRQEHARLPHGDGPAQPAALMVYGGTIRAGHSAAAKTESSTSSRPSKPTANYWPARSTRPSAKRSSATPAPAPAPAAACTPPTRWPRRSKRWACRCPTARRLPADDPGKLDECFRAGAAIRNLLERDIKPRDIMTREAFENAMALVMALGGSTNAVLHLIAMARAVDVPLTIDDFQKISDRVPFLADLEASGKYVMEDLHNVGGTPAVMKLLLEEGLLDGDCMTVTGKTHRREPRTPAGRQDRPERSSRRSTSPIKKDGHIRILRGNLAPDGASAKITGKEGIVFSGTAKVFDSEEDMLAGAEEDRQRRRGRHPLRRPERRPRHARDAHAHLRHHGRRPGQRRRPDHRRPLLRRLARLHRRPRHARSPRRRPDRPGQDRRPRSRSTPTTNTSTSTSPTPNWPRRAAWKAPPYKVHPRHALQVHQEREECLRGLRDRRIKKD